MTAVMFPVFLKKKKTRISVLVKVQYFFSRSQMITEVFDRLFVLCSAIVRCEYFVGNIVVIRLMAQRCAFYNCLQPNNPTPL
jgi:hypothetical protein